MSDSLRVVCSQPRHLWFLVLVVLPIEEIVRNSEGARNDYVLLFQYKYQQTGSHTNHQFTPQLITISLYRDVGIKIGLLVIT